MAPRLRIHSILHYAYYVSYVTTPYPKRPCEMFVADNVIIFVCSKQKSSRVHNRPNTHAVISSKNPSPMTEMHNQKPHLEKLSNVTEEQNGLVS